MQTPSCNCLEPFTTPETGPSSALVSVPQKSGAVRCWIRPVRFSYHQESQSNAGRNTAAHLEGRGFEISQDRNLSFQLGNCAVGTIYDRFFSLLDLGIWSVFQFVDVFISE